VVTTNANADPQKQNNDIDYLISLSVNSIVTVPKTARYLHGRRRPKAGIAFYTIDRSPADAIDMTVLSDNRLAG
jgi:DNA-binding LacI/PurR family transcriptional regulator